MGGSALGRRLPYARAQPRDASVARAQGIDRVPDALVRAAAADVGDRRTRPLRRSGSGLLSSSAAIAMIIPDWQYPHCGTCSSIHARCTGWSSLLASEAFDRRDRSAQRRSRRGSSTTARACRRRARCRRRTPRCRNRTWCPSGLACSRIGPEQGCRRIDVERRRRAVQDEFNHGRRPPRRWACETRPWMVAPASPSRNCPCDVDPRSSRKRRVATLFMTPVSPAEEVSR